MTSTREELVEDVDQALAALRRVILRAIDAPAKPPTILQTIRATAAKPIGQPGKTVLPPRCAPNSGLEPRALPESLRRVSAAGIEIDLNDGVIAFHGNAVTVSRRQAQLAAVLAKASPNFITRADATERAWPDLAASSREVTAAATMAVLAEALAPIKIKVEAMRGYGLRLWSMEDDK